MKPQNLESTAPSSSTTQKSASASLENASTTGGQLRDGKEKTLPFSNEELKEIIDRLEKDIADGRWATTGYAKTDLELMPALIEKANQKYPDMNLKFATTPQDFCRLVKEDIENGVQSSRFIINIKDRGIHFAVIDHQTIDKQTSLVFFEPATFNNLKPAMLGLRTQLAVESHKLPNCHFSLVEMDIQRSASECGMFSLALAKKLHTESGQLKRIHEDNIKGVLCEKNVPLSAEKLDPYLPANFYKHTQGRRRLAEYIKSHPEAEHQKVNKKGETLMERFEKNSVTKEGKTVSVSQHRKRVTEYKSVLTL
ncbi:YopJ/AvrA family T3SS effector serine/threonine acetyltransferase [Bartonella florencae]|uniref:YopJ/AvrA family T3SS effector serine/threonine acetyltransferase n=1 Tax=Bartonella florencae TaxID=928210 RepID=UPI0002F69894|nr:YopJ/AvrA family T3SS effector serine/threonine acetyltransferase [Bartonella florencae]